jgi:predicted signal transduction protein with EAL and GGDEF domain
MRSSDLLVRLGGDEFGILLLEADAAAASGVARRLLAALQEPFVLGTVSVRIRGSIGIALAPTDARDARALMRCADLAMYRAKSTDTGVEVYGEELREGANQLLLLEELRGAVERKQFQLHYQPLVDLRTGKLRAVEALLRWPHPRLGLVPPLRFLPLAEEAGLMGPLTQHVLEAALKQCLAWRQAIPDLVVSINVSASSLLEEAFTDMVTRQMAHHRLPPAALVLEITETTVIREFDRCGRIIAGLRELGLAVSMDDFGAGFTSLAYLGSLAVSEIKLDRVFTSGMAGSERGRELVRATIDLGHSLGLRVVAEGIEDRATLRLLSELGCDLGQGFFIGRPLPPAELDLRSSFDFSESLAA